jgi:hypothetical protein
VFEHRVCAPPESANREGNPKGHITANMVLGPFAETKGPRPPGRNPELVFFRTYIKLFLYDYSTQESNSRITKVR